MLPQLHQRDEQDDASRGNAQSPYLIDTEEAIIVDVEATPTRISKEVDATETMIERTQWRFDLKPERSPFGSRGDASDDDGHLVQLLMVL